MSVFTVMLDFLKQQVMLENVITQGQRSALGCGLQSGRRALMNWKHLETADASLHFDSLPFSVAPCHRNSPCAFLLLFNIHSTPPLPLSVVSLNIFPISSSLPRSLSLCLCLSPPLVTLQSPADKPGGAFVPPAPATHSIDYAAALPSHFNSPAPLILPHSPPPRHSVYLSSPCKPFPPLFSTLLLPSLYP